MSTDVHGPRPPWLPPARPVLAGWALGLALGGPSVLLLCGTVSRLVGGSASTLLAGLGPLVAAPSVLVALVLGLVALGQARRGGPGRGLAVSAVVVSAVQIAVVVVPFVFLMVVFALGGFE